jgi:hypothetical protein
LSTLGFNTSVGGTLTRAMTIDAASRVGIGTTSPADPLVVSKDLGAGTFDLLRLNNANFTFGTGLGSGINFTVANETTVGSLTFAMATSLFTGGSIAKIATRTGSGSYFQVDVNGSERARIDSSGRLLVGTSTARQTGGGFTAQSQIEGAGTVSASSLTITSNRSTDDLGPRLNFARSKGGAIGSNTIVDADAEYGGIYFFGADGSDTDSIGAQISAYVDGTPGANDMPGRLVFSTTADGASSPTERMRITSDGVVVLRKAILNIANFVANVGTDLRVSTTSNLTNGSIAIESYGSATAIRQHFSFSNPNGVVGSISTNASATAYNTSSDYRLKENVVPLTGAIDRLQQIPVHRFNFIADPDTVVDGFIAHEAQEVVPECVTGIKDEVDEDGNPVYQGIDQSKLVPLLTAALQEAITEIASLKDRVAALEAS